MSAHPCEAAFEEAERLGLRSRMSFAPLPPLQHEWEKRIIESTKGDKHPWAGPKFIKNLKAHKAKYPGFDVERVAEYFIRMPESRVSMVYREISDISKTLRKQRRITSLCKNDNW